MVKKISQWMKQHLSGRLAFILALLTSYWLKTLWAYFVDFNLDLSNPYQLLIAIINPIPLGLLLLGLALYIKNSKLFYATAGTIYFLLFAWLFANAVYYREFSDFFSVSTILASSSVSEGFKGQAVTKLFRPWDLVYFLDFVGLIFLIRAKKISLDRSVFPQKQALALTSLSVLLFSINLFLAEIDRPELLSRGFSNTYIVRALGLPAYLSYNANQTYSAEKDRSGASAADLEPVQSFIQTNYAAPNPEFFGKAKGKNVIYLHLESLQQFIIDYKLEVDGQEYEVTPFLNSLYHSNSTLAFSNFFHQVKAGKTSDAETMMDTSLFGLDQGSFMVQYGGSNSQQAAPYILSKLAGYDSAVFHGNSGTFWNRNNTYKRWGYNNFFDISYFSEPTEENSFQYGLNDKVVLADSIQYLELLQQPFYAKYILVSNHYPFTTSLSGDEVGFPLAKGEDATINSYFATANYLDAAVKAFFDYLKESGLYENSIIVLYSDHYGISNSRNPDLAALIGKDPETWSEYDNAMLQRVPYMIVVPGMTEGRIIDTYGGEIDSLPTIEHLLGIETSQFLQVGQDLLSPQKQQIVAMRTADTFVTPEYTSYAGKLYYTDSGIELTNPDETTLAKIENIKNRVASQLATSDAIQTGDLFRFLKTDIGFPDVSTYSYQDSLKKLLEREEALGQESTSLWARKNKQSTVSLFKAPSYQELHKETAETSATTSSDTDDSDTTTETSTSAGN